MKINTALATLLLIIGSIGNLYAQEFEKNIMTGGSKGTYIQIGRDMAKLGRECGLTLNVNESAGSLENLVAVKKRTNMQFGIVQSDVLEYVQTYAQNDPDLKRSVYGVRIMFPLYNEEVQVLAHRKVTSLADLSGLKVAIGKIDSGTYLTSTLILDILRIKDADRLAMGASEALPKLLNGEIDAIFYVAGAPTKLFMEAPIDGAKFHLLNITEPELQATYTSSEIAGGTYPFQPDPVNVVAVKAVLMTYDYKVKKNAYHRQSCKAVSDFSSIILSNLDRLKKSGHPKWRDVNLSELPPGWKVGGCVKTGMATGYKLACRTAVTAAPAGKRDEEYLKLLKLRFK